MSIAASIVIGVLWSVSCFAVLSYILLKVFATAEKIKHRRAIIKKKRIIRGR
jgi:hypothetical protein